MIPKPPFTNEEVLPTDDHRHPRVLSLVDRIATDSAEDKPEHEIALCLSGGGYRAMLFHLGQSCD
jgi:hypothetical protein